MSYFIATTTTRVTDREEASLNAAVRAIDPTACFYTLSTPGNSIRGVIERPNDGTNNHHDQAALNRRMAALLT